MVKRRGKKKKRQEEHGRRRLRQRCGFDSADRDRIIEMIHNGTAKFVEKQSNRVTVFDVEIRGIEARVVYDKERKSIITAVTPDSLNDYKDDLYGH